ncbi:hypothetical protein WMF26_29800 [Sorangium sp. So ce185]|uniref:hypothetical protein n=1 Tax=Sorangium sp. So ce185 TaxID=3133287 RepID=UPI003F5DB515
MNMSSLTSRIERTTHRLIATGAAALSGALALAAGAGEASAGWTCSTFVNNSVDGSMQAASYSGRPHVFYSFWQQQGITPLRVANTTDTNQTVWSHLTLAGDPALPGQHAGLNSIGKAVTYGSTFYFPYVDRFTGGLRVAYKTSNTGAWTHIDVDGNGENVFGDMGFQPAAVVFNDKLFIFYTTVGFAASDRVLRAAVYDGSTWSYQLIDNIGGISNARPVVHDGKLRVFYRSFGNTGTNVRQAVTTNGTGWSLSVLDGDGGANGRTTDHVGGDIAVTTYGSPLGTLDLKVFYINETQKNLRVADFDGTTFTFSVIDGTGGIASGATSGDLGYGIDAISYGENILDWRAPYVFYTDETNHTLRAAWLSGSSWSAIKVDGANSGNTCSGAVTAGSGVGGPAVIRGGGGLFVFYTAGSVGTPLRKAEFTP